MGVTTEEVWESFGRELRGYIARHTQDPYSADDILQNVFERIHRSVGRLREETKLRGWVYRIAKNAIADHYRSRKPAAELPPDLPDEPEGEEEKLAEELSACLGPMLRSLPQIYGEALELYELRGLSHKEMAARLGLSVSGAKSRVQRGRALLKDTLLRCCEFEFDRRGSIMNYTPKQPSSCGVAAAGTGCC